jgi:hypothetical protein
MTNETELLGRALRAYFMTAAHVGYRVDQPDSSSSGPANVGGHDYVALRNVNGVLAVYRVKNNGTLRRLKRWPAELDGGAA